MSNEITDLSVSLFAPVAFDALHSIASSQELARSKDAVFVSARIPWSKLPRVEREAFIAEFKLRVITPTLTAAHHQGPRITAATNNGWKAGENYDLNHKTDPLLKEWTELSPDEVSAIELVQCVAVACRKDIALRERAAKAARAAQ